MLIPVVVNEYEYGNDLGKEPTSNESMETQRREQWHAIVFTCELPRTDWVVFWVTHRGVSINWSERQKKY